MKTQRVFRVLYALFVLSALLACSLASQALNSGTTPSPRSSSTEVGRSSRPIVGTWKELDIPGLTNGANTYLISADKLDDYYYISTATGGTGKPETLRQPASIWRTRDGRAWEMVGEPGMGNPGNWTLTVYAWHEGIYVTAYDGRVFSLWASQDGERFQQIQGDWSAEGDASIHVIADKLFLFIGNNLGAGLQAWSSADGKRFEMVFERGLDDPANTHILHFQGLDPISLDGWTYVGILNLEKGGEIWRTKDGATWEKSLTGGAGDKSNGGFHPQLVYHGYLYATVPPFNAINSKGVSLFRTADGKQWEQVVEDGFGVGDHQATWGWMLAYQDVLYLATANDDPRTMNFPPSGFRLWKSLDGKAWQQIGDPGFGNPNNVMLTMNVVHDEFYLGPYNSKDGNQVWRSTDGENWELFFTAPASQTNQGGGIFEVGDSLIFNTNDPEQGIRIWRYGP